jgi:hypothetical protein
MPQPSSYDVVSSAQIFCSVGLWIPPQRAERKIIYSVLIFKSVLEAPKMVKISSEQVTGQSA